MHAQVLFPNFPQEYSKYKHTFFTSKLTHPSHLLSKVIYITSSLIQPSPQTQYQSSQRLIQLSTLLTTSTSHANLCCCPPSLPIHIFPNYTCIYHMHTFPTSSHILPVRNAYGHPEQTSLIAALLWPSKSCL